MEKQHQQPQSASKVQFYRGFPLLNFPYTPRGRNNGPSPGLPRPIADGKTIFEKLWKARTLAEWENDPRRVTLKSVVSVRDNQHAEEAIQEKNDKLRVALGISEDFIDGTSFSRSVRSKDRQLLQSNSPYSSSYSPSQHVKKRKHSLSPGERSSESPDARKYSKPPKKHKKERDSPYSKKKKKKRNKDNHKRKPSPISVSGSSSSSLSSSSQSSRSSSSASRSSMSSHSSHSTLSRSTLRRKKKTSKKTKRKHATQRQSRRDLYEKSKLESLFSKKKKKHPGSGSENKNGNSSGPLPSTAQQGRRRDKFVDGYRMMTLSPLEDIPDDVDDKAQSCSPSSPAGSTNMPSLEEFAYAKFSKKRGLSPTAASLALPLKSAKQLVVAPPDKEDARSCPVLPSLANIKSSIKPSNSVGHSPVSFTFKKQLEKIKGTAWSPPHTNGGINDDDTDKGKKERGHDEDRNGNESTHRSKTRHSSRSSYSSYSHSSRETSRAKSRSHSHSSYSSSSLRGKHRRPRSRSYSRRSSDRSRSKSYSSRHRHGPTTSRSRSRSRSYTRSHSRHSSYSHSPSRSRSTSRTWSYSSSRSLSIPRRRGSPSFLEKRRITRYCVSRKGRHHASSSSSSSLSTNSSSYSSSSDHRYRRHRRRSPRLPYSRPSSDRSHS